MIVLGDSYDRSLMEDDPHASIAILINSFT